MNVSSVKNLNGETFSAVQDATLTDVVQSNSAAWGQGGGLIGDYVSGVNLVKEPYEEGGVRGAFCSANVSGDVSVTTGEYDGTSYIDHKTYSLTSLGTQINDKLDTYFISNSKTLANLDGLYEVFERAYRYTGTATASADKVMIDGDGRCYIEFFKSNNLKNVTIIVESNTEGNIDEAGWDSVSYENNSATLKKFYKSNQIVPFAVFTIGYSDGLYVTNCDATCTTYSGIEISELAFKDELPTYEYDGTNKISSINGSAIAGGGGGAISSYTSSWCNDVPPYGDQVIEKLNDKYLKAFISNSADKSNFANNANSANSANYAETVNETYVENKGFTRNLSSEYGTISVIHNNIIESTNSAISRVGNEGFVSAFEGQSIGPEGNGTATYSWDKSLPNTIIALDMSWSNNEILTYSANTNLTGEIVLPTGVNIQTINIPNATEFKVWSNIWIGLNGATVSAADQFETVVGELAWASALPTYEYDNTNKISAINGSAIAQPTLSSLNTANVNNIIVTTSLPSTPDANTLYLIPET